MKNFSIPKLELQAALLMSHLRLEIKEFLKRIILRSYMWTDSTTALQCFNSTSKLPVYVANRVSEIHQQLMSDSMCPMATIQQVQALVE